MKTCCIILVALLLGINSTIAETTAQSNNSFNDSLIVKIQNGHFSDVAKSVAISDAESFLKFCKRNGINKSLQDSLCYYISKYYAIDCTPNYLVWDVSKVWTDALHFTEKHLGRKDSLYWHLLDYQCAILADKNDFNGVDSCLAIKLKYQKKVLGKTHPDCIRTMQDLAWYNYLVSQQTNLSDSKVKNSGLFKAWNYATLASFAAWRQYGFKSIEHAKAEQYDLVIRYITNNLWLDSQFSVFWENDEIYHLYRDSLQTNTEHYFELLTLQASINFDLHKYSEALYYIQEMEHVANTNQDRQQLFLSNYFIGYYYQQIGDYQHAEEYYNTCMSNYVSVTRTPILYANPPEYNMARFFHDIGDYDKSNDFAHLVLKNIHMAIDYARMYMILGENAMAIQQYDTAQQFLDMSWRNFSLILESKESKDIWPILARLAYLKDDCEYALKYSEQALALALFKSAWDSNFDEYDPMFYEVFIERLYYIGRCLGNNWTDDYIEEHFSEARSVYQKSYGTKHNKYAELLYHYANWTQNVDSAALAIQKYVDIYHKNFVTTTTFLSEKQRERYWQTIIPKLENTPLLMWSLLETHPEMLDVMYNNELFCKGALLKATNQIVQSIMSSGDSVLITDWERLTWLHENLEYQINQAVSNALYNMQQEAEQLEKKIVAKSSEYRQDQKQWAINVDSVKKYLPSDALAIEFLIIPEADKKWHCALLLRNNYKHPEVIVLFEEKEVSSFLSTSKGNITNQTYDYCSNGDTISQLVWSKIQPKIKEGETIYFAPSGLLHQLAIEYLPFDENSTMSDVYNMVRLSSTREIVLNKQNTEYTTATIYGGIAYDLEEDILLVESENYATENLLASRSIENDTLNRGNVKYLPGTKKEAESINALLKQNNISAKLYMTAKANEESFKSLSGKHNNILHIGTHGFTWTDSLAKKQEFFAQRVQLMGQEQYYDTSIDPLNRCGLLFAGANIALQGNSKNLPEGVQDGILTAKEISLLDLRDANLVVLSACETAKGDITSEGVFGLQRAFKMAGVQTIIMSLWKVNDQATQLLMTEFYNNWIGKHQSKREAFRNAQNSVRTRYEEPEYWAGFIMLD